MQDKECERCPLFIKTQTNPLPPGCLFAWRMYEILDSPAVQRFSLQDLALSAHTVSLDQDEAAELLGLLDSIITGIESARRDSQKSGTDNG